MKAQRSVIVLTGSSSGIGASAARDLAAKGATVCLLARREELLADVAAEITESGGRAFAYAVDLTDDEAVQTVIEKILADHGRVDVLVNNAGHSIRRAIHDATDRLHDYERTIEINYLAAVRLTLALLETFREQGHGHVVFSSTMSTQVPIPLFSAYLGSKAALESFARSLMAEHGHEHITTTIVYFPMVRTEMSGATDIYAAMPMMSADRAGRWLVKAALDQPTRVTSLTGAAAQAGMSVLPGLLTKAITPQLRRMDQILAKRSRRS